MVKIAIVEIACKCQHHRWVLESESCAFTPDYWKDCPGDINHQDCPLEDLAEHDKQEQNKGIDALAQELIPYFVRSATKKMIREIAVRLKEA